MNGITPELRQAIERAGGKPVEVTDPQTNVAYYLVRADVYERMRERIEEEEDLREQRAWAELSRKARAGWAKENAFE